MEKELKFKILSKRDYEKIAATFENLCSVSIQENYYYDTKGMLLLMNDSVLRARIEKGKVLITYKNLKERKNGYFISKEVEDFSTIDEFQKVLSGEKYILDLCSNCRGIVINAVKNSKLVLMGKIVNERRAFYHEEIKFELDKVDFGGGHTDYEIEVESELEKEARDRLTELLRSLEIQYQIQSKTKYQRFLEANKIKIPFRRDNNSKIK